MERSIETPDQDSITPRAPRFLVLWAVCCLVFYGAGGYFGARFLRSDAAKTAGIRQSMIESWSQQRNALPPGDSIPSTIRPGDVHVGLSLNRIENIDAKESAWTGNFALSFRWTGEIVNPGDRFRIANGEILRLEKQGSFNDGSEHYVQYNVVARITRSFSSSRFPIGDFGLIIDVEDTTSSAASLRYVAERRNSEVRPGAIPRNVDLNLFTVAAEMRGGSSGPLKPTAYATANEAHSHFIFAMLLTPDRFGIYQRLFRALFGSVAIALIVLFIRPVNVDPRFGLPVGGFFAAVTNTVSTSSVLPYSDRLTLVDMVNVTGLFTIFLILVQSAISLHIEESGHEKLHRRFDMISFAVITVGYIAVNLALPLSARSM